MSIAKSARAPLPLVDEDRSAGRFRVNRDAFLSEEVLALEQERIFDRCWLYLAHESEVAAARSFLTRDVAGKPILLTRDKDGELRAFHNVCTHRGALVCRERSGTAPAFTCPYHAWTFSLSGKLNGMPGREGLAADANDDGSLNLRPVARLEVFRGFIFICFDTEVEPLLDYLKESADYLAYVADQGPNGMEIVAGAQEYAINANWKLLLENSIDGYHGMPTHSTYFEYLRSRDGAPAKQVKVGNVGWVKNLGNGHAVGESIGEVPWGRPYARWVPGFGEASRGEIDTLQAEIMERLGPERGAVVATGDRNLAVFPNLVVNDIMAITVRTFYPAGPDRMVVTSWALAPIGESEESRARRLRNYVEFLGPAGFATPDDIEMLEAAQKGYVSGGWNDVSRGMLLEKQSKTEELALRTFWRRWNQLVTDGSEEELVGP
ncbi:aromatic ring-hydroxylating dioxygenase subunit alpha [Sphingoaurantiacus capsulatus]|uniref:Aromatic ring-hydroxylating dioxygenase subunit alpha n=1 Tax=Sphingoaurantiacus capsulatus TaxID=1771310 RepID=A0ABV7X731_9SPHN